MFTRIVPDEYYLFSSNGYALAAVWSLLCVNLGFEQFATTAGIYAAQNPLWPWIMFQ